MKNFNLFMRRIVGFFSRLVPLGYSHCYHCGRTWNIVRKMHCTQYDDVWGCCPLCEKCWRDMTIEQRVKAHWQLYLDWQKFGAVDVEKWHAIERAVRGGK